MLGGRGAGREQQAREDRQVASSFATEREARSAACSCMGLHGTHAPDVKQDKVVSAWVFQDLSSWLAPIAS